MSENILSLYERAGGADFFRRLVDRFYVGVASDPLLRPMYPEDLTESRRTFTLFLVQYFGGPGDYSQERGHPRLRMRHMPFSIGQAERDAWMHHMQAAVDGEAMEAEIRETLMEYFERVATFMMNRHSHSGNLPLSP